MRVRVHKIDREFEEQVVIECHEVRTEIADIVTYIKSKGNTLPVYEENKEYKVPVQDIYYLESVDNHVYVYLKKNVYELKMKLYEFEELYGRYEFVRCSKSSIVNLLKIDHLKPALNSRFTARLINGEEVIISRQYASSFRKKIKKAGSAS